LIPQLSVYAHPLKLGSDQEKEIFRCLKDDIIALATALAGFHQGSGTLA
jgi:hypothetical protein